VWKLLIIKPFCQWKLNKIETENFSGIWGCSWCEWKTQGESNLIKFISQFSELTCERYFFLSEFCCWKFKQIAKIGFGRKNQLSPQCIHTCVKGTGYTSPNDAMACMSNWKYAKSHEWNHTKCRATPTKQGVLKISTCPRWSQGVLISGMPHSKGISRCKALAENYLKLFPITQWKSTSITFKKQTVLKMTRRLPRRKSPG